MLMLHPRFLKRSAYWWQVLRSSWLYCCQESSSRPEQKLSTLPVPLRSLSFQTLHLWWAHRFEDRQRYQLSTSLQLILKKSVTQVSEAATILVQSFGELFDQAELDVQRWEEYPIFVHHYDVPCSTRHQFLP